MPITDKLNASWTAQQQSAAVFQIRAAAENCFNVMQETIQQIDAIAADSKFTTVDVEIKTEGQAIRKIINDAKNLLVAKTEFISWKQPVSVQALEK